MVPMPDDIVDVATEPVEAAVDAAQAAADAAEAAADAVIDAAEATAQQLADTAEADRFAALEREIAAIAARPVDAIGEHTHPEIESALNDIQDSIGKLSEATADVADVAVDAVDDVVDTTTEPIADVVEPVAEPVLDAVETAPKRASFWFRKWF
jgi:uncharacterized protein YicC (UPF0701 family)